MRYTIDSDGSPSPLDIREIGYAKDPAVTCFGPGRRDCYIVHYVLKGAGRYNGSPVRAGQGFLIYPGQSTAYKAEADDPWEFLWIIGTGDGMEPIFRRYNADGDTFVFSFAPEGLAALNRTAGTLVAGGNAIADSLTVLETYLHLLNATVPAGSGAKTVPNAELYLTFAEKYVEDHISLPVTVGELTGLLGVSQPYLYRIFQKGFQTSPKQYVLSRKLYRAKKLLAETDLSVAEIAHSVGYDDPLAFSRLFARKEKISPQQYRRSMFALTGKQ